MTDRKLYAKLNRDERGKKQVSFGKVWGKLTKKQGNTECMKTGDGLWVLDIDTKNYKKIPKKLLKLLPKATVETANGFHYYFNGEGLPQTQGLIDLVDVRNEGGLVFTKYTGDDKNISYKRIGKITEPSKKLMDYLTGLSASHTKKSAKVLDLNYKEGKPWKQYKDGEQHTMLMATMVKMFNERATDEEVWSRADDYRKDYLSGGDYSDKHEMKLMKGRFDWAKAQIGDTKVKGTSVKPKKKKLSKSKKKKVAKAKGEPWKKFLLQGGEFDTEDADKVNEIELMSFIPKHHHTVVYGASGTMKTSIITHEMVNALKEDGELEVFLLSFDASALHNRAMWRYAKKQGVTDRFHVMHDINKDYLFEFIKRAKKKDWNLDKAVIIIDTYKKIAGNVNDKGNNVEVMALLKTLTERGCTLITIAHTNKDGLTNSGTAELEQDTDGLLRFDVHKDSSGATVSITQGGRVRFPFEECSYRVDGTESYDDVLDTITALDRYIDVSSINARDDKRKAVQDRDGDKIESIKEAIRDGKLSITPITEVTRLSAKVVKRILESNTGVHWAVDGVNQGGGNKYKIIKVLG